MHSLHRPNIDRWKYPVWVHTPLRAIPIPQVRCACEWEADWSERVADALPLPPHRCIARQALSRRTPFDYIGNMKNHDAGKARLDGPSLLCNVRMPFVKQVCLGTLLRLPDLRRARLHVMQMLQNNVNCPDAALRDHRGGVG